MQIRRLAVAGLVLSGVTLGASDFLTEGVDNGRTGWVKDEKVFTTANVGSMKLLWKLKLDSTPRAMHNLFAPLIAERVTTAAGHSRNRGRRRRQRRSVRHRRRHGAADLAQALRRRAGRNRRRPTTRCARPARRRCRRWRRCRRASTRSTPSRGTAGCGRSTSPTARTSRRRRSSCRAAASRTRSTCTTASSTPPPRRAAAA